MSSEPKSAPLGRREFLGAAVAAVGIQTIGRQIGPLAHAKDGAASAVERSDAVRSTPPENPRPARLRQSVCRWPFASIPLPQFAAMCGRLGFGAIDLLYADEWAVAEDAGLVCSTGYPSHRSDFIARGFNDRASHALLLKELETTLPVAQRHGVRNVITMFGNAGGRTESEGIDACIDGLRRIAPLAEETGVNVIVEMLNSKVDHRGYQADSTRYGVEVAKGVGSARVRLLYDIYHMQIMEGDVIRTIRANHEYFAHYHTAGNPGRNELNDAQELQYGAIMNAIAETGFDGWVAHEFIPTIDPETGLRQARDRCTV